MSNTPALELGKIPIIILHDNLEEAQNIALELSAPNFLRLFFKTQVAFERSCILNVEERAELILSIITNATLDAIAKADVVIALWSSDSKLLWQYRDSLSAALVAGNLVFISVDGSEPPLGFRQCTTFTGQVNNEQFEHLIQLLQAAKHGEHRQAEEPGLSQAPPSAPPSPTPHETEDEEGDLDETHDFGSGWLGLGIVLSVAVVLALLISGGFWMLEAHFKKQEQSRDYSPSASPSEQALTEPVSRTAAIKTGSEIRPAEASAKLPPATLKIASPMKEASAEKPRTQESETVPPPFLSVGPGALSSSRIAGEKQGNEAKPEAKSLKAASPKPAPERFDRSWIDTRPSSLIFWLMVPLSLIGLIVAAIGSYKFLKPTFIKIRVSRKMTSVSAVSAFQSAVHEGKPELFISYARKDLVQVKPVVEELERLGVSPWIDWQNIRGGMGWAGEVVRAIRDCDGTIVMCSSAAFRSDDVVRELYIASHFGKPIGPVFLEDATPPDEFLFFLLRPQQMRLFEVAANQRLQKLENYVASVMLGGNRLPQHA